MNKHLCFAYFFRLKIEEKTAMSNIEYYWENSLTNEHTSPDAPAFLSG